MPGLLRETLAALALYERGELHEAGQRLAAILPQARQIGAADTLIISHVLMARLALIRGERETWLRHLIELERFGQQSGCAQAQCAAWLERSRVATLNNQLDVAQVALQTAQSIGGRRSSKLAMEQDGLKHPRLAMQTLDRVLRLAGDGGFLQCLIDEGDPWAALLRRWGEQRCAHSDRTIAPITLTTREIQVLHLLAAGHRNRIIAQELFLSECTVKTHLHKINVKLGARSRTQALAIARARGWLD
jgi:LuxR family maltose regulon positive regulatory protein